STPISPPAATLSCAYWKVAHGVVTAPQDALSIPVFETHTLLSGAASSGVACTSVSRAPSVAKESGKLVMTIPPGRRARGFGYPISALLVQCQEAGRRAVRPDVVVDAVVAVGDDLPAVHRADAGAVAGDRRIAE